MADSNSKRFIDAYNRLDKGLHDIYNIKQGITFSDSVRRVSDVNSIIRKYQDDLIEYGRLRNAIVHESGEEVIAEPNIKVVEKLESIARLICTPPRVMDTVANRSVLIVDSRAKVRDIIVKMFETGYSVIPVYKNNSLIGVINRKLLIESLGAAINAKIDLDDFGEMSVEEAIDFDGNLNTYEVVPSAVTIDNVLFLFQSNKKLSVVVITKNGNYDEQPLGVVVASDTIEMQSIIDNY